MPPSSIHLSYKPLQAPDLKYKSPPLPPLLSCLLSFILFCYTTPKKPTRSNTMDGEQQWKREAGISEIKTWERCFDEQRFLFLEEYWNFSIMMGGIWVLGSRLLYDWIWKYWILLKRRSRGWNERETSPTRPKQWLAKISPTWTQCPVQSNI
jgi:hypothetical protein